MVQSHPTLLAGGFNEVVFADSLYELLPYLERLSAKRTADVELDGGEGLGDLLLVRRAFGPEILPLWRRQGRLQRPWRRPRCGDPRSAEHRPREPSPAQQAGSLQALLGATVRRGMHQRHPTAR
jgi:hypothetical protein